MSQRNSSNRTGGTSLTENDEDAELLIMKMVAARANMDDEEFARTHANGRPAEQTEVTRTTTETARRAPERAANNDRRIDPLDSPNSASEQFSIMKAVAALSHAPEESSDRVGEQQEQIPPCSSSNAAAEPVPVQAVNAAPPEKGSIPPGSRGPGAYSRAPGQTSQRLDTVEYGPLAGSGAQNDPEAGRNGMRDDTNASAPVVSGTLEEDPETDQNNSKGNTNRNKRMCMIKGFVGSGLMGTVVLILLLAFLLPKGKAMSKSPTEAGETQIESPRKYALGLLPNNTLQAMEDINSPQSKAFEWLMEDLSFLNASYSDDRVQQRLALATFYFATTDPSYNWKNDVNWLSYDDHECSWWGVSCSYGESATGTRPVQGLDLEDNFLAGTFPPELFWLQKITFVRLSKNKIGGALPPFFDKLANLKVLKLDYNAIAGSIPIELGSNSVLVNLDLGNNRLDATLPTQLGLLTTLESMHLSGNGLTGAIPTELGLMAALESLLLYKNSLSGAIPSEFGLMTALESLHLYMNGLTGAIPTELGLMTALESLLLYKNSLSGAIPSEFGLMTALESLHLYRNGLTGTIPNHLGLLTALKSMNITDNNNMKGDIPEGILISVLLGELTLSVNEGIIRATIPTEIGQYGELIHLTLARYMGLAGKIPTEVGLLTNLESFDASGFNGSIPSELGNMEQLRKLDLSSNNFTGSTTPSELGKLVNLVALRLDQNHLGGSIPTEFGGLENLVRLDLRRNYLTGEVPSELGQLEHLKRLMLGTNHFSGTIPSELSGVRYIQYDQP
jgi:Leucine-rich repeat (LRR) protein